MVEQQRLDGMPLEDMEYSIASQIAYEYYDRNKDADATQQILDTYIQGYILDPEVSNDNASTVVRPDGSAILAFRGTRPNVSDLNADAAILAGQHHGLNIPHPRFVDADTTYNAVKSKYDDVDITGHSLGGTLADYIARSYNENAVIFNPGETPLSNSPVQGRSANTRMYLTDSFDLVSFSNPMYSNENQIYRIPQSTGSGYTDSWLNSHSLVNFLPRQEMLPISYEDDDTIVPSQIPTTVDVTSEETLRSIINVNDKNMPNRFKVKFDKNGDRCPTDPNELRRFPECGSYDPARIPFQPYKPPHPHPHPHHDPFKPYRMQGVPRGLNQRSTGPDSPPRPVPSFPTAPSSLVGGATGPGDQFTLEKLPQDETNTLLGKAVRKIVPKEPGYERVSQTPVESQSARVGRQLRSANFRNQTADNAGVTLDDIIASRGATEMADLRATAQSFSPEMNAAVEDAIRTTGAIYDDGAGAIPQPRSAPQADSRDTEFGPEPIEREAPFRSPPRRFRRPARVQTEPRNVGAGSSSQPRGETSATISAPGASVELQELVDTRLPPPQQRLGGMRNVEEDPNRVVPGDIELQPTEMGEDVRGRPGVMAGRKRKGEYFEVDQSSPSRMVRASASRGRTMSQLQGRASQVARNLRFQAENVKRARVAFTDAVANRARGVARDIQSATVRQFGQGYERVVSDSAGIRRAQAISGERPMGQGRPIQPDIELQTPVAAAADGSISINRPVTEDVTGQMFDVDLDTDFSPFDQVVDEPTVAGAGPTERPKLSFSERLSAARQGITARGVAEGTGVGGVGFLAGMGVAQLLGPNLHTGNKFADASIVGGVSGVAGDVSARTAGLIAQKAAIKFGTTAATDAAVFTASRAGMAMLRGGLEGAGIGIVAAPLDILLNNFLVNGPAHMNHAGANVVSSTAVGLGTTATLGAISLAAAPETAGLSLLVGGIATGVSALVGFFTGKAQDDEEHKAKEEAEKERQRIIGYSNARKALLASLPSHGYSFSDALAAFPDKASLAIQDPTWAAFSTHSNNLFTGRPQNHPPPPPGSTSGDTDPDNVRINDLFGKYITHELIGQVCQGQGSKCDTLRTHDQGPLTADEIKFLDDKTAKTWQPQADMQVTMSVQELDYTSVRIQRAQSQMIDLWNNRQKLPTQMDGYLTDTAFLDPTFEERFRTAIKEDAQKRVIDAYYNDQTKLQQMAPNIQTAAGYDPHFITLVNAFYTDMESTASDLEVTVPQLIQLQGLDGEAQRTKYQEYQFDRVKEQAPVVSDARDLAAQQDKVRAAGFYDIDQAYMETDPTAIGQWQPTDSQILQAHMAGMNLNQYVAYMHELSKGDAGDFTKLPTYTAAQLRQYGLTDASHLQDELQKGGFRRDLYIYDPDTRMFTLNPNVPSLPDMDEAKSFISAYTPQYLVKARQEYADMVHGLNEANQQQVDQYNTDLRRQLSVYGDQYEAAVASQNEYLASHPYGVTRFLHFHADEAYNKYRLEYNPLSDALPMKDKKVTDGTVISAPNIPPVGVDTDKMRKKKAAAARFGLTVTEYDKMKHDLQKDGYDASNMSDSIITRYAANSMGMSVTDYSAYKTSVQKDRLKKSTQASTPFKAIPSDANLNMQKIKEANPNLPNVNFSKSQINTLAGGGSVTANNNAVYASA